ncbi:MAG: DNA/RNA nuclease SfsA [Nitrospirae bacterium]|nr:MAG: DNA/RNA nuclease SfsA [Nitrospirota bacterium]
MRFDAPLIPATLVRRYKRFLADVTLEDGRTLTVHCANPGRMDGCAEPGSPVLLSDSRNPRRKLRYTWELTRTPTTWVGVNTQRTNAIAREGIESGVVAELAGYPVVRAEVRFGAASRVDLLLEGAGPPCLVEVKNVTLAEAGCALFPDAVTRRGRTHLEELARRAAAGDRAVMLYVVNREDCHRFAPAAHIDPAYAEAFARAVAGGVEVLVYAARVRPEGITLARRISEIRTPARLGATRRPRGA